MSGARKRSVALAIVDPERPGQVLLVRRPPDDEDLPDIWGLPAASLLAAESWTDAARRVGREKLGVDLAIGAERNRGTARRAGYTLEMRLLEAAIREGTPTVPQPAPGVTQYAALRWGSVEDLAPAAALGSLCSRLYLDLD